jgi:hypothetical protein
MNPIIRALRGRLIRIAFLKVRDRFVRHYGLTLRP